MKFRLKQILPTLAAGLLVGLNTTTAEAQEAFGGFPPCFNETSGTLRAAESTNLVKIAPNFNVADLKSLDQWGTDDLHFKPLQIGKVIPASINFAGEATKVTLETGKELYRLVISSPGAMAMTLTYSDFFIPNDGSKLYIYNANRTALLGAYTYETHPKHGVFSNEPVQGDELILEYVPGASAEMPSLLISGIGYIYYPHIGIGSLNKTQKGFNPGEDNSDPTCQVRSGINCPDGAEWQTEKAGVIQMVMYEEGYLGCCSANLLNNTNEDFAPYIISAAHCINGDNEKPLTIQDDLDKWTFRFHYEKPTCSNGSEGLSRGKSIIGCTVKTYLPITDEKGTPKSDGLLLLANNKVPENYRVYYNGWDRRTPLPKGKVTGIHHPSGDAKKICSSPELLGLGTWDTPGSAGGKMAHFRVEFTHGDTEGGSSGSSLFDKNHLVIGTLTGGRSGCGSTNYYGRLFYHWNRYKKTGNPLSSMDIYLDPKTQGEAEKLEGTWRNGLKPLQRVPGISVDLVEDNIKLTWKAVSKESVPSEWKIFYRIYRNGEFIKEVDSDSEMSFTESRAEALGGKDRIGSVVYGVQVRYNYNGQTIPDDGHNNGNPYTYGDSDMAECGMYLGELATKVPVTVKESGSGVNLSWEEPTYLQEVSLFGYPENMELATYTRPQCDMKGRWESSRRFNLAVRMPSDKFAKEKAPCVYAVNLVPDTKAQGKYRLYIRNGAKYSKTAGGVVGRVYEQPFDVPDTWKEGEWITVLLDKPLQFDPMDDLFVGYSVDNDKAPLGLAYVKDSGDALRWYYDAFLLVNDLIQPVPEDYYKGSTPPDAYHAIRVVFASSPKAEKQTDFKCFVKGKTAVPFPVVKGYKVIKNGAEIANNVTGTSYNDASGKTTDNYEVVASYENTTYADGITGTEPEVYPTLLNANATLNVKNNSNVVRLSVFGMDGKLLMQIDNPTESVDLSTLPDGVFVVTLDTAARRISQRITKSDLF